MRHKLRFVFRDVSRYCDIYLDMRPNARFIFITLLDAELIEAFGTYITIETDFKQVLPAPEDYNALIELKEAIFITVKRIQEFTTASEGNLVSYTSIRQETDNVYNNTDLII